jgi:hypothetical protein
MRRGNILAKATTNAKARVDARPVTMVARAKTLARAKAVAPLTEVNRN